MATRTKPSERSKKAGLDDDERETPRPSRGGKDRASCWLIRGATVAVLGTLGLGAPARAQVAGSTTTIGVSVVEATRVAMGWSVKKGLLGRSVYNESGDKIGKVEDLIISPDRAVSYLIIGAGGFVCKVQLGFGIEKLRTLAFVVIVFGGQATT